MLNIRNSAHEGATRSRRASTLNAPRSGPNRINNAEKGTLRDRTLAAHRNFPLIFSGIEKNVINEVGSGITIKAASNDEKFNEKSNQLWPLFVSRSDPEGVLNWHGQVQQAVRCRRTQGEVFLRRRNYLENNQNVTKIQVLEPSYCPIDLNETLKNGRKIREGIEFDKKGRRRAYYFYKEHPEDTETTGSFRDYIRVPAKNVIHHFVPTRPGQRRGAPDGTQGLLKSITFNSYDDAELQRKEQRAPYTGFIKRAVDYSQYEEGENFVYDPGTGEEIHPDFEGLPEIEVKAGTMVHGYPGDEMTLFDGDDSGKGYGDFMRWQCISIALAHGIPYELLTGDWSKVNDRLVRIIMQQYYRGIEAIQDLILIHQVAKRCWEWFIDDSLLSGKLIASGFSLHREKFYAATFRPHGWDYIHPEQDVNAKIKAAKNDLTSIDNEVAKKGLDPQQIEKMNLQKLKRKLQAFHDLGLTDDDIERLAKIQKIQSNELDPAASGVSTLGDK